MAKSIRQKAKLLMNEAGTTDLMQIAEYLNVTVLEKEYSNAVRGYCFSIDEITYIIINSIFQECKKKIILAHEIAHLYLHRKNKINTMAGKITFFPINNLTEIEANIFAAELIINDEFEVDEYVKECDDLTLARLLSFKLTKFNKKGIKKFQEILKSREVTI